MRYIDQLRSILLYYFEEFMSKLKDFKNVLGLQGNKVVMK